MTVIIHDKIRADEGDLVSEELRKRAAQCIQISVIRQRTQSVIVLDCDSTFKATEKQRRYYSVQAYIGASSLFCLSTKLRSFTSLNGKTCPSIFTLTTPNLRTKVLSITYCVSIIYVIGCSSFFLQIAMSNIVRSLGTHHLSLHINYLHINDLLATMTMPVQVPC